MFQLFENSSTLFLVISLKILSGFLPQRKPATSAVIANARVRLPKLELPTGETVR